MKRVLTATGAAVAVGAIAFAVSAPAQTPPPTPSWPPGKAQVFIWSDTVTADTGKQENFFSRTSRVVFRAYAVDLKPRKVLIPADVTFFYVKIPGQPNVKMKYGRQGTGPRAPFLWTGTWTIPADYPLGVVDFRVLVHTKAKHHGVFQQAPVAAAQLTVTVGL